ncbi:hypothetical protein GGR57DRAFT_475147 [Xylariaceae sp. FL1272]|nr:hypothetical protein GGR57DRAFT_475147 [Xylariaceae sp. FL1272]
MGQAESRPHYEGNEPEETDHDVSYHNQNSDDLAFPSQIPSSIQPKYPSPPRRRIRNRDNSSPTQLVFGSSPPSNHKSPDSFSGVPTFAAPVLSSDQADGEGTHSSSKKKRNKRKRSKNRTSSMSHHDPDESVLYGQEHENGMLEDLNDEGQLLDLQKRDKKELRRQAKLARQQELASAAVNIHEQQEPNRFSQLWEPQEHAKYEPIEGNVGEELPIPIDPNLLDPAIMEESIPSRRRKRKAQDQDEGQSEQNGKKNKRSRSRQMGIQAENGHGPGESDINFNDLAEQIYSDQKKTSFMDHFPPDAQQDGTHDGMTGLAMGVDDDAHAIVRIESDLMANAQPEMDTGDKIVENYPDDAIDGDYVGQDDRNDASTQDQSQIHVTEALNVNGHDDIQVPPSVPQPDGAEDLNFNYVEEGKAATTGRKRVAKPNFFDRVQELDENGLQSPSTAAVNRRKGKGKQVAGPHNGDEASPSTANGKVKQPKISSMLEGPETPSNNSVVRLRTPRTPVTVTGAFSDLELRNLSQAIERYREDTGKSQHEVNELIHGNPKDAKSNELWERIMATCVGRSRQKVINQTRRKFHNFVARGTWTPEQEQELRQMYEQYGNKYALIGQLINRHPEDIRDRIRNYLVCGDSRRKDQWNQEEQDQLIAIVEQAIEQIHVERAKQGDSSGRPVEEDINWQLVSQGMGRTRSRLQCISKWKAIKPQLVGGGLDGETAPMEEIIEKGRQTAITMSYRNRSLVIQAIQRTGANADSRIPWLKVRTELNMQWTRPPLMIVWFRLRRTVENWQTLNVKEICIVLLQRFKEFHKLDYIEDSSNDFSLEAEYREVEYKIKRGRKSHTTIKTPAIAKTSDDEDDAVVDQLDAPAADAAEHEIVSQRTRSHRQNSVDLGMHSGAVENPEEREVADSDPDVKTRNDTQRRRTRSQPDDVQGPDDVQEEGYESGNQSSDTHASQASSIPAR